jgi:hypothetical protein
MKAQRGWRAVRLGVVAGLIGGFAVAAARFVPKLVARRSFRRLAATRTTEELWPPIPSRAGGPVRVDAPLAGGPDDGDAPEGG